MGGLWAHPIKLLDGFLLQVNGTWLTEGTAHEGGPYLQEFHYSGLRKGLVVERHQYVPDGEPALVVRSTFTSPVDRSLRLRFLARTDLTGVWLADMDGIRYGYDHAAWEPSLQAWLCEDDLNPWRVAVGARKATPVARDVGATCAGPRRHRGE